MQTRIDEEILASARRVEVKREQGHNVHARDTADPMYRVENINNFFLGVDGHLFVIFAYGNISHTNAIDKIIF